MTTDNPPTEHRLRNAARRPVELHLDDTTLILQPGDIVTIAVDEPYSAALLRRGVLTRQTSPAAPTPDEKATAKTKKKTRSAPKRPVSTAEEDGPAPAPDPSNATDNLAGEDL